MADLPRPHRDPNSGHKLRPYDETRMDPPRRSDPAPSGKERFTGDTQPMNIPPQAAGRDPSHRNTPAPTGKERFTGDTQPMDIPPRMYDREAEQDYDPRSDYGIPDGYDPYDPPRRPRRRTGSQPRPRREEYRPPQATYFDDDQPRRQKRRAAPQRRRRRRRSSFGGRILRGLVIFCAAVFALYSGVSLALISKLDKVSDGPRTVTTGSIGNAQYTRTVLLIGTDSRDLTHERGRSDSMILLTINDATHEIYMSSLMRDTYVEIPNRGFDKLNAAYSYGGAELLMDTIEKNFDVSIDDYVCVSFTGFAGVIDAFGGVEITLSDEEAQAVNIILQSEVNELMGDDPMSDFLPSGGSYVLTGKQALSYARIRYVGNADFERTSRQREVMEKLMQNAKRRAGQAVPQLMSNALPHVSTNMTTGELYLLSLRLPVAVWYDTRQQQIPADGTWAAADVGGVSVLQIDEAANQQILRDTAYAAHKAPEE